MRREGVNAHMVKSPEQIDRASRKVSPTRFAPEICQLALLPTQLLPAQMSSKWKYIVGKCGVFIIFVITLQETTNTKMKTKPTSTKMSSCQLTCIKKKKNRDSLVFDLKADLINRSCDQMGLLISTINSLEVRISRATQVHTRSLLNARIQVLQAVYNKLYCYTAQKAHQIAKEHSGVSAA